MSIRLAHRLQRIRPSATVGMTAKAISLREAGHDIISLSAGEPDFATPEHIRAAGIEAIRSGNTKYTALDGTHQLKLAIAAKLRRENGLDYEPAQILVTSGAKQACFNACQALLDLGDEVVVPAPYWVSYPEMVRLADAEPVIVHTAAEHDFTMTAEQLAGAITPATRLVILNSPCNPTGSVYTRTQWQTLGAVLREHPRVIVLSDEIYEHIYWADEPFASFADACPDLYERTLTVNGMSKGYAMSGWRLGYAAGPVALIKAMTTIQGQSTTNACTISQAAARAALNGDQKSVREMCAAFKERHDAILPRLAAIPGFACRPAQGAFYLFPNVAEAMRMKGIDDDVVLCERLLDSAGVAVVPGSAFGAPGHLRISFAASLETLVTALARVEKFMAA
ncbi:MAG TPA: pyridoxal phosphate-dependent aminotransferase [Gammaproteobacteria bacterium]